ncbi:MAG: hypothetical protein N2114_02020, partial [Candidatus Goldbacteria bacterium]|nr:hypothetical protein [Candidatus Goldiibacteriota bacterium]
MKKTFKNIILLFFILWCGFVIILNVYLTPFIKKLNPDIKYFFIFSFIPDRITFVNFQYKNFKALLLTADMYLFELLKKDYDKFLNGISIIYGTLKFVKKSNNANNIENGNEMNFKFPFCQSISVMKSKIIYEDRDQMVMLLIDNINGKSQYFNKGKKDIEY